LAIGTIRHDWVDESTRREYHQVRGAVVARHIAHEGAIKPHGAKLTEDEIRHAVLSDLEYRYLARMSCWTLIIRGVPAYVILAADSTELDVLIASTRSEARSAIGAVLGYRTGTAPPEMCGGSELPMVVAHKVYSFSHDALVEGLLTRLLQGESGEVKPIPANQKDDLAKSSIELFDRLIQSTGDGMGKGRVLAWALLRSSGIYAKNYEMSRRDFSLTNVSVKLPRISAGKTARLTLRFTNVFTGFTESYCQDVNVSGLYPYLVSGLAPCLDR
jgi:hypothetical protein